MNWITDVAKKIRYGARLLTWLADSLASFPVFPKEEKQAGTNAASVGPVSKATEKQIQ